MRDQTNPVSLPYLEGLFDEYLRDRGSVPPDWAEYFDGLTRSNGDLAGFRLGPSFEPTTLFDAAPRLAGLAPVTGVPAAAGAAPSAKLAEVENQLLHMRVRRLLYNYRSHGHLAAQIDPLGRPRPAAPDLDPAAAGLGPQDVQRSVTIDGETLTVAQIISRLRNTYCGSIGAQFMHISDPKIRQWLTRRMETTENRLALSRAQQLQILRRLVDAVVFEQFIQKKFLGAKSFSLEGAETLLPLVDLTIEKAGQQGVAEIVIGMAHRGRLNVLANVMGKRARDIFSEFQDTDPQSYQGSGDVKYHLGYSADWTTTEQKRVHLSLCFNPSHLEFIDPVAVGRIRAKQDRCGEAGQRRGMALLIHGDAAFAGEGVIQETLNLSQLPAYTVGGTLHVVINNQLGFTTPPAQSRSSIYATDVAKMLDIPILHVNGEDPEAVAQTVEVAMEFRATFGRDVVIDMYSYRRRGHNEGDEPAFTQPKMYQLIENHPPVGEIYLEQLLKLGEVTREQAQQIAHQRIEKLEAELTESRQPRQSAGGGEMGGVWKDYVGGPELPQYSEAKTAVPAERLAQLMQSMTQFPDDFHPHSKIDLLARGRREMAEGKRPLDWAGAEALAFATLAVEGTRVRLTGQDCQRGTFSQRHAVLHDVQDGHTYTPLHHLSPDQAPVEIYNSPLSETAVLGFEYGFSLDYPDGLVMWEAQFGDFINVAQVVIDQFIAAAEAKWRRLSGIVLLLPHGMEGQGPEHSSARLERFLMLASKDNMQVVNPSTPAQYYHLLRRQVLRPWRKPLIVLTPKSLLRHKEAVSPLADLATGTFQRILGDPAIKDWAAVKRVLLCSGKVYYELEERRKKLGRTDVAIVRLEQMYPFPTKQLSDTLAKVRDGTPVVWVQEEPQNMGAWYYLRGKFGSQLLDRLPLSCVTRPESASPATGSHSAHKLEQDQLLTQAFVNL